MSKLFNGHVATLVVMCGIIYHSVSNRVQEPFIDEIFHLTQCQTYCKYGYSNWKEHWDNKITTPPGLYLLGYAYSYILEHLISNGDGILYVCGENDILRSVNLLGGLLILPLVLQLLVAKVSGARDQWWIINIVMTPLLFSYYFLFYTDVWSTIFILSSLVFAVAKPFKCTGLNILLSAGMGFVSLSFRQTNIMWIAFVYSYFIDNTVDRNQGFVTRSVDFIKQIFINWVYAIPYMVNFVLFLVFVKINGGITFGDKENHEVNFHGVQIFYCFTFMTLFSWPVWLSPEKLLKYFKFLTGNYGFNLLLNLGSMVAIKYVIDHFTIVHPFLLADNRHYTFYIYKRILSHPKSFILTVPVYHFSTWCVIDTLLENKLFSLSPITVFTFLVAIFTTIIPSPLFEPRYYIIPVIFFRLFISPPHKSRLIRHEIEFTWYFLVNCIYFIVFFSYEFKWASEGDSIQRIIW